MTNLMPILRLLTIAVAALLVTACQTTSIRSAWYDTSYNGGLLKKVVVIASDGTTADSRVFEDIFVQKLNAAGVTGVPGYSTIPPGARGTEGPFAAAVAATGADAVLMIRLLRVDTKTQVSTIMMPGPMWGPWGGFYGGPAWYPRHRRHAVRRRYRGVEPVPGEHQAPDLGGDDADVEPFIGSAGGARVCGSLDRAVSSAGSRAGSEINGLLGGAQPHRAAVAQREHEFVAGDARSPPPATTGAGTRHRANRRDSRSWWWPQVPASSHRRRPRSHRCRDCSRRATARGPRAQMRACTARVRSARSSCRPPVRSAAIATPVPPVQLRTRQSPAALHWPGHTPVRSPTPARARHRRRVRTAGGPVEGEVKSSSRGRGWRAVARIIPRALHSRGWAEDAAAGHRAPRSSRWQSLARVRPARAPVARCIRVVGPASDSAAHACPFSSKIVAATQRIPSACSSSSSAKPRARMSASSAASSAPDVNVCGV